MRFLNLKTAAACAVLLGTAAFATPAFADSTHICQGNADCSTGGGNGGNGGSGGSGGSGGNGGQGGNGGNQQQQQQQANAQAQAVSVNTYSERDPVNTAYAAPLVTSDDTCMGSSSIGGQGVGFGLSIGTTWTDVNCQRLKNARQLSSFGFTRGAVALLCVDEDVQSAMAAAGTPCPAKREARAEETRAPERVSEVKEEEHKVAENKTGTNAVPTYPVAPAYHFVPMQPISD